MDNNNSSGVFWFLIILVIVMAIGYFVFRNYTEADFVSAEYDTKIVYQEDAARDVLERDCADRGGSFNECGSGCEPGAEMCTTVCVPVCELVTTGEQNGTSTQSLDMSTWNTYEAEEVSVQFRYPPQATLSHEAGRVKVTYLGPNMDTGTEITDGFSLTAHPVSTSSTNIEAQARDALQNIEGVMMDTLSQQTIAGINVYTFTAESTLGSTVTYVYVRDQEDNAVIEVTYSIAGNQTDNYQQLIEGIISTMSYSDMDGATVNQVSLAFLDTERTTGGEERGCDLVVMTPVDIDSTEAPLTAALERLFSYEQTTVEGNYNFIAETNDTLMFDRATIQNGVAHIYLTGELSGLSGVCDNPRARIQIEETALQFGTVSNVQLYLNGEQTELQPSGRGEQ